MQRNNDSEQSILQQQSETLQEVQIAFQDLQTLIEANPLRYNPHVPQELKDLAGDLNIREKIGESFYDFSTNPAYRKHNVSYALEKIQGTVVQPGEEFNFADIVYPRGEGLRGFRMGWVINGGEEVRAVGGGICGSSTTVFEAAYRSGLEITERRSHSIYYRHLYPMEKIGLDAAVFRPRPNLRFINNTGNPILLYLTYPEPHVANLQIWGTKHFESLRLDGPNRVRNKTTWYRTIRYNDGREEIDELVSRFSSIR